MNYPDDYYGSQSADNDDPNNDTFGPERLEHETEQARIACGKGQL